MSRDRCRGQKEKEKEKEIAIEHEIENEIEIEIELEIEEEIVEANEEGIAFAAVDFLEDPWRSFLGLAASGASLLFYEPGGGEYQCFAFFTYLELAFRIEIFDFERDAHGRLRSVWTKTINETDGNYQ